MPKRVCATEFNADYAPPRNPEIVDKLIEEINLLCRKYKYAELKDHDIITDTEFEFYVDYHFNGKILGAVTLVVEKTTSGDYTARTYLSIKTGRRLPLSNLASFICDFKAKLKYLHINIIEE